MFAAIRPVFTRALVLGVALGFAAPVFAAEGTKLFNFVRENEEIVAALTPEDAVLGEDAGAIGKALHDRGTMTVWRYAVRKAEDGALEHAPLAKISLSAQGNLRVEPYATPLRVVPLQ
ncbi:hypothetical protein GB928_020055 [Shinella curvata]|uniref:YpeB-like protein with protease inhibitory function n=1 Tax=Shinella curvata TaxID=1817964 RepID=A0ABT8XIC1_9HYPH|nr:hypothetical protein [Shinella curvata]MCJ8055907.1 hypothetical protein [Shinella curvata]MDO6123492.1 hypothetical protein [Shinella curvata]